MTPILLHEGLVRSATRHPDTVAFRFRTERLSYAALRDRVHQLGNYLRARGLQSMDRVGIFMPKCLEQVVAVHGILAAGGAFVPIDPASPPERVAYILRECGIRFLVTHPNRARMLAQVLEKEIRLDALIGLDEEIGTARGWPTVSWRTVHEAATHPPAARILEEDLAYVMFTSGSTGAPKGLMHTHASGLAYARQAARTYGLRHGDRMGNHSPLHFDMSTLEFFAGPLVGATVVLIPDEVKLFPVALAKLIAEERLTIWYSVPLALVQVLERGEAERQDWSSLRWILYGGEPFPPRPLQALFEKCPHARYSNVYGPAEVNQCTFFHFDATYPLDDHTTIPLGQVWAGAEGLILNNEGEPVERGEIGELLVRTPTLMRGYWGRSDLTTQGFSEVETLPGFHRRFYRTGDLVRENGDGLLEFIGRKDRQIKIRGYRLELDEVERVLNAFPAVSEAAVVDLRAPAKETQVVAFVIPRAGETLDLAALFAHAKDHLPPYGVPSKIVLRASFPRTGSGKTDRSALRLLPLD